MKERKFQNKEINKSENNKTTLKNFGIYSKKRFLVISILMLLIIAGLFGINNNTSMNARISSNMQFNEITENDYQTQSDNVKFTAYFLSGEKKLDGTQNRIGYSDTMYFDFSMTEGRLENPKIEIDSQNYYLETNLMSDSIISQNYVSSDTEEIVLNNLSGNVSKVIEGSVKSGDYQYITEISRAIGEDISNYNKQTTITFTALYIDDEGNQTPIEKSVDLNICWYGEINCEIPEEVYGINNLIQKYNITDYIDSENGEITLEFNVATQETENEVLINKSYIEGTIPLINDIEPTNVVVEGENVEYTYDEETRIFTANRTATIEDNVLTEPAYSGTYAQNEVNYRYNEYTVKVTYPIETYTQDDDEYINIDIPVTANYEGVNGEKSSNATGVINVSYSNFESLNSGMSISIGRNVLYPEERQVISKDNILSAYEYGSRNNGNVESTYYTKWNIVTNQEETATSVILTDNSVEDKFITSSGTEFQNNGYIINKGIAFSNPISALGTDGWIRVYNDETDELIHTFTAEDWADYDTLTPYEYENDVRYIRIETSEIAENSFVIIYNIKEFDINKITQEISLEQFNDLKYIATSFNGNLQIGDNPVNNTTVEKANFEEEISVINFQVLPNEVIAQGSNNIQIEIDPNMSQYNSSLWRNEEFLIKFPSDIIDVTINRITTDSNNITVSNYYEYNEDNSLFIKIEMDGNGITDYELLLDCMISVDPHSIAKTSEIELYAYNEENNLFYHTDVAQDIYDVNNNFDTNENVGKKSYDINIVVPETLLATQSTSNATAENETIYAPLTAIVENDNRIATVDMELKNNTHNNISEVKVLGKIPFEDNKYHLSDEELGSTYTAELTSDGIRLPDELSRYATVYYSENEEVNDDTTDLSNGWTEEILDYSKVRNFLIVFNRYEIQPDEVIKISYDIRVPDDIQYNEISYSTYTVYFSKNDNGEVTRESTEVDKLGFMIAKRVDFELTTYNLDDNSPINGAVYKLTETGDRQTSTVLTSNSNGVINISELLLEKVYTLEQIGISEDYVLNNNKIEFRAYEEDSEIKLDLTGNFAEDPEINQDTQVISAYLYNEVRYDLSLTNLNYSNQGIISTFSLEGNGETIEATSNSDGSLIFEGLYPEQEYVLTQIYSKGYYIEDNSEITLTVTRGENGLELVSNDTTFNLNRNSGEVKPIVSGTITNEEIPSYSLTVTLYERDTNIPLEDSEYVITGDGKENGENYVTNDSGSFTITDLYSYIDGRNVTGEYILKQTEPTIGYALSANDIKFVVTMNPDTQELTLNIISGEIRQEYIIEGNNISIGLDARKIFNITTIDGESVDLLPGVKLIIKELAIVDNQEVEIDPMDEFGNILGEEEVINGETCRVFTTNEDGIIEEPLRDGIYKIIKINVPEGYELEENEEDRTYYVGIGETRGASVEAEFRDPVYIGGSGDTSPEDYYVAGRDDGYGLFYHRGQLTLLNEENEEIKTISSNAVNQIIDDNGTFVVLEDSRIVKYNDNLEIIAEYNLTSGMDSFAKIPDGGYVIVGQFSGNKTINGSNTVSGSNISIDSVTTGSWFFQRDTVDVFIMKVNANGKVENMVNVGGTGSDMATYVTVTSSGNFVVSSHMTSTSISGDMMSDGNEESGDFEDCYFVMDSNTMKVNQIISVGTSRGDVEASEGNAHIAFAGNDGGVYYVGQMSGTVTFSGNETESGSPITVTSTGDTDAYIAKFNSEGKVVWAIAIGGVSTDHIYSAEYTSDGELLIGGDSYGGAITVDGSNTSSGMDIVSSPIGNNASEWRGIALKVDSQGRLVWANEFGYSSDEGIYAFAGFTGNSYVICGFDTISGSKTDVYIRVDEAESRSEISEVEGLEITSEKAKYKITTSVNSEGGTITGQDQEMLEEVIYGGNTTIPIVVAPNDGYKILAIEVNGEKISFTPDENNSVTLSLFQNVTEDLNIVAYFSNNTSRVVVHHYLYGTDDTRVAEDEVIVGIVGDEYTTGPEIGLTGYELAINDDGTYIIDGKTSGVFDEFDTEVNYYYVETPVRVIVNHFIEGTNSPLSPTIEYEYERNETYTTNVATDIPEEYELVRVPSNATGVIEESEIVVTYYYRLKPLYNYTIEYYYEGQIDESQTESLEAIEGKVIDTYIDKPKDGYVFDRVEGIPLTITSEEENNIIKVYYKAREDLEYRVEYYYDGVIEDEKTATYDNIKFGTIITQYTSQVIEGYQLERVENVPLTVGTNTDENIIKVFYTKRHDLYYTVNYYEQNTSNKISESKEVGGNTYHSIITETPIDIEGYNKVSEESQSITIEVDETKNVINFYYTKRTDLNYTVNYYEEGTQDKIAESKVVENQTFESVVQEEAIDIAGFNKLEPTEQEIEIAVQNNVINFYYERRTDIGYIVEYYYDGIIDSNLTKHYTGTFEDVIESYEPEEKNAYEFVRTENLPLTISAVEANNIIKVFYERIDATITENTLTKTATDKITEENGRVEYTLTYNAKLENYIGDVEITIVDNLPYGVLEGTYGAVGGIYNETDKTIIFTERIENIDTYTDEQTGEISITKTFSVVYKDIDYSNTEIVNKASANMLLDTTNQNIASSEVEATTLTEFTKNVTVTKIWDDNNNEANKRPDSIKILVKNEDSTVGEQEIDIENAVDGNENTWEYTFENLQKYDENGQEINYTADEETEIEFYIKNTNGLTVTNTFTQDETKVNIPVTVKWEDNETQELRRPESVIIVLKANGVEQTRYELSGTGDEWKYTFTNLPKFDSYNNIINYTIEEQETNPGDLYFYTISAVAGDMENGFVVTNTFEEPGDTVSLTVNKVWDDQENVYNKRPNDVRVLVKAENETVETGIIEAENGWTYTFNNLSKYNENGQEIEYSLVEEETQEGNLFYYTGQVGTVTEASDSTLTATITNKMTKIPAIVNVKYVDKYTNSEISDATKLDGVVGDTFDITDKVKEIEGYTLIEEPENKTGEYTVSPQEFTYYYAKNTSVTIKYLEKDDTPDDNKDNVKVADETQILGYEGLAYDAQTEIKEVENYTLIDNSGNLTGTMSRDGTEVIYYYAKNTQVVVRYVDQNKNNEELDRIVISGYEGKEYNTEELTIEGYTAVGKTENTSGYMTEEEIEVIYYYSKNTSVIVKYLEKDDTPDSLSDNQVLAQEKIISGYVGKDYQTEEVTVQGYTRVEIIGDTVGKMTEAQIEVIYYYLQNTSVKVQHIDRETNEVLAEEVIEGLVGDIAETQAQVIENYVVVGEPDNPNIVMTKQEQTVTYYYAHVSQGVIEEHIDEITGNLIEESILHKGNEGDPYNIEAKTFEGYDLVTSKLPTNSSGKMLKDDVIEVKYYYIKRAKVIVQYVDETNGNKIDVDLEINGHEKDNYLTESKDIPGYNLVSDSGNTSGEMIVIVNEDGSFNIETIVTYYYKEIAGGVIENHIDIATNEVIESNSYEGNVGDPYETSFKEIEGYDLIETDEDGNSMLPTNNIGNMTTEEIIVNYYYEKRAKVIIEHIDKLTGEVLNTDEIAGHIGDSYETFSQEFDRYDLTQKPQSEKGTMTSEEIVIKYYYSRKAEVEVKYIEKDTGYEISETVTIDGYVADEYKTEQKDLEYYNFIENTENYEGTMTEEKIEVIYYYERKEFNFKIDNWVQSINVNGIITSEKNYETNDELSRLDLSRHNLNESRVLVTYKIRITNTGEIEGKVGKITDLIPAGYSFYQEDNNIIWNNNNGILTTDILKDEVIMPGEYKEIEITLRWSGGEANLGQQDNTVILSDASNPAGFKDTNDEDNTDTASLILSVATGLDRNTRIVLLRVLHTLFIILVICIVIEHKIKRKSRKDSA